MTHADEGRSGLSFSGRGGKCGFIGGEEGLGDWSGRRWGPWLEWGRRPREARAEGLSTCTPGGALGTAAQGKGARGRMHTTACAAGALPAAACGAARQPVAWGGADGRRSAGVGGRVAGREDTRDQAAWEGWSTWEGQVCTGGEKGPHATHAQRADGLPATPSNSSAAGRVCSACARAGCTGWPWRRCRLGIHSVGTCVSGQQAGRGGRRGGTHAYASKRCGRQAWGAPRQANNPSKEAL